MYCGSLFVSRSGGTMEEPCILRLCILEAAVDGTAKGNSRQSNLLAGLTV
jgi:hypothetical protein